MDIDKKLENLKGILREMDSVIVALSGGVDSALLLKVASEVLGDRCIAATAVAEIYPSWELAEADELAKEAGVTHVKLPFNPIQDVEGFLKNPTDRCYLCKSVVFGKLVELAKELGIRFVVDGTNLDDLGDYRPGLKAVKELGVQSPLLMAEITKSEIRELSRKYKLSTSDKPSIACLATRIPYNEEITAEKLHLIDLAEQLILSSGIRNVRVRCHGNLARIEVEPQDIPKFMDSDLRTRINNGLKEIGFQFVSIDLAGYRTGSMNTEV